jgi:hypothetical protein
MVAIAYPDLVADRSDALASRGLDGLRLALVTLPPGPNPNHADVELHFYTGLHLASILTDIGGDPVRARQIFRIRGGSRIVAGNLTRQVQVGAVSSIDALTLSLRVAPVGDYSTYTLELVWDAALIDPFFSRIEFKFRPGCFTNDCAPALPGRPAVPGPAIDYLAKDFDSFRHTLLVAMAERVPGWQSSSEADLDQTLISLFAASADELSDYQDRVMAEATLATTRKRLSLARHARLVDYHVGEGQQASTWLMLEIAGGVAPFSFDNQQVVAWTGTMPPGEDAVFFASRQQHLPQAERQRIDPLLNRLRLHTWRDAQPALAAGSTSADIAPLSGLANQAAADALRDLVRQGLWREMMVQEMLNPLTGAPAGAKRSKRQLLRLHQGNGAAESVFDPVTSTWVVRVNWRGEDALRQDYSFTTFCPGPPPTTIHDVSMFFGNLLPVHEGRPMTVHFHEPGSALGIDTATEKFRTFARRGRSSMDWVLAALPDEGPLAYLPGRPGAVAGEEPSRTTLFVEVEPPGAARETWDEVESLVRSDDSAENGDHFMVETDERRRSTLRFGNGTNGRLLPQNAIVHAQYQIGQGAGGNVGADTIVNFEPLTGALGGALTAVRNPFDVTDGIDPEPAEHVRRFAPEAFRARQLRAVTIADYVKRAEEVEGVSRAVARYAWTGSWRTVRVVVDPAGFAAVGDEESDALWDALRPRIAAHLESVRLIGEDLELRPPRYVPLDILAVVCADPAYWREDIRFVLEQEFSDSWTSDGRPGFFHPDQWTFGLALHRSAIEGRIHKIAGVAHIVRIVMKRFSAPLPGAPGAEVLELDFDEVVLVANDPSHLERGIIRFEVQGGRA